MMFCPFFVLFLLIHSFIFCKKGLCPNYLKCTSAQPNRASCDRCYRFSYPCSLDKNTTTIARDSKRRKLTVLKCEACRERKFKVIRPENIIFSSPFPSSAFLVFNYANKDQVSPSRRNLANDMLPMQRQKFAMFTL
jgi:hypothetical protein